MLISLVAFATTCNQVYPSAYAYYTDSVYETERNSANCRNQYPPSGFGSHYYILCNGTQLRLTDSDYGSEQYTTSDYYVWPAETRSQLLFIFPTRINLTTITLHYYSSSGRGLPRLRFYAVPDDFDVWDAPTASYSNVKVAAVPPGGEPAGRRNVSVDIPVYTRKVLLYKFASTFSFTVSEVEFIICTGKA